MKDRGPLLVSMRDIHVSYDAVQALRGIDFDLAKGEIHGLLGEHRAGKSTLVKLLSGAVAKERGTIWFDGQEIQSFTPKTAVQNRISIVYQSMNVIPSISAIENIFTGQRLTSRLGFLDRKGMERAAVELFRTLKVDIDPYARLEELTEAEQLMVEIAKALSIDPQLLIFDEISSKLTPREMEVIYRLLFDFRERGRSVIYISHNMDEIFQYADRVTILKNGLRQGTEEIQDIDKLKLIKLTYSFVLSREELEQDNRELYLLKKYNESIIRNLPVGVIILDQKKRISIVNFAAIRILALKDEVLMEQPVATLLSRCAMERAAEIEEKVSGREEQTWEELHCAENALIRLKIFPFTDDEDAHLGTILVIEDISRDRYFQDYLLRSEKIASIAELATGVAHEISNPLSVVLNYVDLLKRRHRDDADSERLAKIERELSRIGEIIGSLLSFSKVRKIPMEPLNVARILDDVVLLVEHKVREKEVDLRLAAVPPDIWVFGEENSLTQVFVNLLINSVEAVLAHGRIDISVTRIEPDDYVEVAVQDDGCGIPAEIMERIFDPFFSTKAGKKNTGLGLSICQHIVEAHEGVILCSSAENTVMRVRLPIYRDGA
jgi:signal transduction histidine kinase/ABC-type branched-subunit amino acid transport system ATPase component